MIQRKDDQPQREPKDLRYRRTCFKDGDKLVFDTGKKGFVPLPIIMRKLLRHVSASEWRILTYLHLRCSRFGICYPTLEEMAYELGLSGRKNISPHLKSLEDKRLISSNTMGGKRYYLVHDPRVAIEHLAAHGKLNEGEMAEINDLYEDLHQPPVL